MSEQTIKLYNKQAAFYEGRWESYLAHTHKEFIARIKTTETDTILDISGGTGLLAQMLIKHGYPFEHLIINDPSEQMLAIAQNRLSGKANISFANYQAENIPFEANSFDCIFCLNSFHFYSRQQHVFDRCYTMLRPGGRFCILDWNREGFFRTVNPFIKWLTSAHIDTRSLEEMDQLFGKSEFENLNSETWNWRYWKFFFIELHKYI